jgi:hypothetical protein
MRLIALLLTGWLLSPAALAQQVQPSSAAAGASSQPDATPATTPALPVSLDKIRDGLERTAAPGILLKNVEDNPTFRVEILERRKIEALLATLDFKSGPTPPGGVYGYEQQRVMFPAVDNPMAQPYAAFSQTELAIVSAESAINMMLAKYLAKGIRNAYRASQEQAARAEVERAIAEYCASKPNGGAGIQLCVPPTTSPVASTPP